MEIVTGEHHLSEIKASVVPMVHSLQLVSKMVSELLLSKRLKPESPKKAIAEELP